MTTTIAPATTAGTDLTTQKADVEAAFTALVKGLDTELGTVDPFLLAGKTIPRATVLGTLQARIDAAEKTRAARTAFHLAVENERAIAADAQVLRSQLKGLLQVRLGATSTKLQEFGFTPRKRGKTSAAAKASGVQKAKATKKVRGIVGNDPQAIAGPAQPTQVGTAPAAASPPSPAAPAQPAPTPGAPRPAAVTNGS